MCPAAEGAQLTLLIIVEIEVPRPSILGAVLQFSSLPCLQPELGSPSHPQPRPWKTRKPGKLESRPGWISSFGGLTPSKTPPWHHRPMAGGDETQQMFEALNRSGDAQKTRQPGAYRRAAVLILASPTGLAGVGDLPFCSIAAASCCLRPAAITLSLPAPRDPVLNGI